MSESFHDSPLVHGHAAPVLSPALAAAPRITHARFAIGDTVKHRLLDFRGVVFDVDPVFANSEQWYEAIPQDIRPDRGQPFYHLLADNGESSYVAYVSQENLERCHDVSPVEHPAIALLFRRDEEGRYALESRCWH